jgi:DNA uptake protein ComE-like DNA-binding protein
VLWILVGVAALGLVVSLTGRDAVAAAQNRGDLARARWLAAGCAERVRAAVSDALIAGKDQPPGVRSPWVTLDSAVAASPLVRGCDFTLRARGTALNVNTADADQLRALFVVSGESPEAADSLADALEDWRDGDDANHPMGAEARWYAAAVRPRPRNAPLADVRELRRVRGFESREGLDSLLTVDSARIDINHAPLAVLAALPGFGAEALARVGQMRAAGQRMESLAPVEMRLSASARAELDRRLPELATMTTAEPDGWVVTARGKVGEPAVTAVLELGLVRAGVRAAIVRRRTWTE